MTLLEKGLRDGCYDMDPEEFADGVVELYQGMFPAFAARKNGIEHLLCRWTDYSALCRSICSKFSIRPHDDWLVGWALLYRRKSSRLPVSNGHA